MRVLIRLVTVVSLVFLGTIALGNLAERWLIYPLDPSRVAPSDIGLPDLRVHKMRHLDETLIVWTATPKPDQPVILYFQGNAGNLAMRAGRFQRFLQRGYGLIAMAYPGSSGSSGPPSETAITQAARHLWLNKEQMWPEIYPPSAQPIATILYGESIGAAVSIALNASLTSDAASNAPLPSAIILEAPFTSIPALAEQHYPGTASLAQKLDNQWDSLIAAARLQLPLLIIHGTDDELIPIIMGQKIFATAPSEHKQFLAVEGAAHTNLWRSDTLPKLWRFIDQLALR